MGNTSSTTKNQWNEKNYDRVTIMVKAGEKQILKDAAAEAGKSVSRFIVEAVNQSAGKPLLTVLDDSSKRKK